MSKYRGRGDTLCSVSTTDQVLIIGLGHTGTVLAERLTGRGVHVVGTVRSEEKAQTLALPGLEVRVADLAVPETLARLCPEGAAIVVTSPPVDGGLAALFAAAEAAHPRSLTLVGTTGVYLEADGGRVTPEAPVKPEDDPRAGPRLADERTLRETADRWEVPGMVFRAAGIYGRGRGLEHRLREGRVRLWGGGHNLLNRIHVDDLAALLEAAIARPHAGIFNAADDHPCTLAEHAGWLVGQLGLPPPPRAPLEDAPSPTLVGSKHVDATASWETFGVVPRYPTYKDGFRG